MTSDSDPTAGFSTMELLVAFVILSLGLGIAVQTIAQSATNLRRSTGHAEETFLLRRLLAEELPRLAVTSQGLALAANGPAWEIRIEPRPGLQDRRSINATIDLAAGIGEVSYKVLLPGLRDAASASGPP